MDDRQWVWFATDCQWKAPMKTLRINKWFIADSCIRVDRQFFLQIAWIQLKERKVRVSNDSSIELLEHNKKN